VLLKSRVTHRVEKTPGLLCEKTETGKKTTKKTTKKSKNLNCAALKISRASLSK
jgi:hypothetical protein